MTYKKLIRGTSPLLLVALFSGKISAANSVSNCMASNYFELVACAEKSSSEIQISEQQYRSAQELEGLANQWVNPELEAESVSKGSESSETSASLLFTLRLGGKRSAVASEAQGETARALALRNLTVDKARLDLRLALYRLSQIKNEIHIEEESVETFSTIIRQFQKRPALSPEQDVSLSVFKMALADHQLRLTKLKTNEEKIFLSLMATTGLPKQVISKNLPSRKSQWPAVEADGMSASSPQERVAMAELKIAESQKQKAAAESWPDLKVGPTVKTTKSSGEAETYVGIGLSIPLPVFTTNGAGRAYSAQKLIEAELNLELNKRQTAAGRRELVNRYNQTVQSLNNSLSLNIVEAKHKQLESQFFKGLVPSSLVIEAHRQLFELEENRNASELEALEALGQIFILDNKFNEVKL